MDRRQQTFAAKGRIVNTLGSVGPMIFVAGIQLCHWGIKSAKENVQNEWVWLCFNKILVTKNRWRDGFFQ